MAIQPIHGSACIDTQPNTVESRTFPSLSKTNKIQEVFIRQQSVVVQQSDVKQSQETLEAQAYSLAEKAKNACKENNYHAGYLHYLKAKGLYEMLPKSIPYTRKLIKCYYNLARSAREIRTMRRLTVKNMNWTICCPLFSFIFCMELKCCSHWVDDQTFRSYIDKGLKILDDLIKTIHQAHGISKDTDKSTPPNEVRKELGWAYQMKGYFYTLKDGGLDSEQLCNTCLWNCCFEGNNAQLDASRFDPTEAGSSFNLAKEWDTDLAKK